MQPNTALDERIFLKREMSHLRFVLQTARDMALQSGDMVLADYLTSELRRSIVRDVVNERTMEARQPQRISVALTA